MIASKKIASDVVLFGLFWICIFGHWHTVNALGDDSSIYLVDFDETAYDLYLKGYYPSDYTYADFRRNSIESMTSHYVATDSNNFSAIVDTIEQDVLLNGWSVIENFFEDAWINLKTGDITVARGFTDDFKHTLDGRFKSGGSVSGGAVDINGHRWTATEYTSYTGRLIFGSTSNSQNPPENVTIYHCFVTIGGSLSNVYCTWSTSPCYIIEVITGAGISAYNVSSAYSFGGSSYYYASGQIAVYPNGPYTSQYGSLSAALADFYGAGQPSTDLTWNGDGYYSDFDTTYSINLPALPYIDWSSISNNNKTKYGIDFPDIDLTVDFQLPDSYYPQTVTYDTPYWLYNTDSTPVDWVNVSFEDVTLPDVQMSDGDGSFFQALFGTLPLAFVPIFLGVILCYLIFLML